MAPDRAAPFIAAMIARLRQQAPVEIGRFGADMKVALTNDGPVTIWIDSRARERA
jgi:D-tyrosyl-tRNA(Tyr) deacylase